MCNIGLLIFCTLYCLALEYHPDRNPGGESEFNTKFQAIQVAHEILCDPHQGLKYDTERLRAGYGELYQNATSEENTSSYAPNKPATPKPSQASSQEPPLSGAQKYAKYAAASHQQTRADAFQASQAQLPPKTVWSKIDPSSAEGDRSRTSTRDNLGARTIFGSPIDEAARSQERTISKPISRTTTPWLPAVATEADEDQATMPKPVRRRSTPMLDGMEIDERTQTSKTIPTLIKPQNRKMIHPT